MEGLEAIACRSVERGGMALTIFDGDDVNWFRLHSNFLFFDPLEISSSVVEQE